MLDAWVEDINNKVTRLCNEGVTTRQQLDHIDSMLHEVVQFLDEHKPALAKALAFMEPGRTIRDYFGRGKAATDGR